jgi:site-specific recombinase XerD
MRYKSTSTPRPRRVRKSLTLADAIASYLLYHESSNSQPKTLKWHTHCLGAFRLFCDQRELVNIEDITAEDAQRWIIDLQKGVSSRGKARSSRTLSWYVRSLRAFVAWSCQRGYLEEDFTSWLDLPKMEKPLIRILEPEEFTQLLQACTPGNKEHHTSGTHFIARNEAILWMLYDTGIRLAELCNLRLIDYDRARGTIIVLGKRRKERKIALGRNALQVVGRYLTHWRDQFESAEYDQHFFLTEQGALTHHGVEMLFKRLKQRVNFGERRLYPHLFRHTFAVRYLMNGGDVFSLQELLGHEDMETIRNYMHLADANVQSQKRKFSPGDQIELTPRKAKRTGFRKVKS